MELVILRQQVIFHISGSPGKKKKTRLQRAAGALGRERMIAVYDYTKMCLGLLVKTESCCIFPSALGL